MPLLLAVSATVCVAGVHRWWRVCVWQYWKLYLESQGIDGVLPDIEGFHSGGNGSDPNWYSNATLTTFMSEIKAEIGADRVLLFPIQVNWWDVRDDHGGGQDYTALAAATDGLFLMACPCRLYSHKIGL